MADNNDGLDWTKEKQTITVNVDYDDPTPTPPLEVTPDEDGLTQAAENNARQLASKTWLKDMRSSIAQWILLCGYVLSKSVQTARQLGVDIANFKQSMSTRQVDVEKRMTAQESTYKQLIKQLTDADTGDAAAEVIASRNSSFYGSYASLKARLDALDVKVASAIPGGFNVTINHGLGRNPDVSVKYYEWALGTEPDGLGTGPEGTFGGTPAVTLTATVSYLDADTVQLELPAGYKMNGTVFYQPADYCWYLIDGYRILKFNLGVTASDKPDTSGGSASGEGDTSNPDDSGDPDESDDVPATPKNLQATRVDETTEQLTWE